MNPTISIIVPIYNVERYLERCVNSLINQTYKNIEVILVDDGSTDASGMLCDELGSRDVRLRVIHKKNGGVSDARNAGINVSTGEYILLVDPDDFVEKTICEELIGVAQKTGADLVSFREEKIDEESGTILENTAVETKTVKIMSGYEAGENYLYGKYIQHSPWSKLYKRKLFDRVLFPVGMLAEDYATTYLYVFYSEKVAYYDRKLYFYSIRANSIMTQRSMKLTMDVYKAASKIYEFELEHYPHERKIVETAYANCLLKTIARIYNEYRECYVDEQREIESRLLKLDIRNLSPKTLLPYMCFRVNKKAFAKIMKRVGLNG